MAYVQGREGDPRDPKIVFGKGYERSLRDLIKLHTLSGSKNPFTSWVLSYDCEISVAQAAADAEFHCGQLLPGMENGVNYLAVGWLHKEYPKLPNGRPDLSKAPTSGLHIIALNKELTTNRFLNAFYYKDDGPRMSLARDVLNGMHGYTSPDDPARAQGVRISNGAPPVTIALQKGLTKAVIDNPKIKSRADAIKWLKAQGAEIHREGEDYISLSHRTLGIKRDGKPRTLRLKGEVWERDPRALERFRAKRRGGKIVETTLGVLIKEARAEANAHAPASLDELKAKLALLTEGKRKFLISKYKLTQSKGLTNEQSHRTAVKGDARADYRAETGADTRLPGVGHLDHEAAAGNPGGKPSSGGPVGGPVEAADPHHERSYRADAGCRKLDRGCIEVPTDPKVAIPELPELAPYKPKPMDWKLLLAGFIRKIADFLRPAVDPAEAEVRSWPARDQAFYLAPELDRRAVKWAPPTPKADWSVFAAAATARATPDDFKAAVKNYKIDHRPPGGAVAARAARRIADIEGPANPA